MDEYIKRDDANIAILDYISEMTVSKYGSLEECRMARFGAERVLSVLDSLPTADVVPKSEVEELTREKESLAKTVNEASELIRKLRSKIDELKKDRYQVLPDGRIELLPRTDIEKIKTDAAREILSEIREAYEKYGGAYGMLQKINELEQRLGAIDFNKCRHFVGCESCRTGQVCGEFERIEN